MFRVSLHRKVCEEKYTNGIISFPQPRLALLWWKRVSGASGAIYAKMRRMRRARTGSKLHRNSPAQFTKIPVFLLARLSYTSFHTYSTHLHIPQALRLSLVKTITYFITTHPRFAQLPRTSLVEKLMFKGVCKRDIFFARQRTCPCFVYG